MCRFEASARAAHPDHHTTIPTPPHFDNGNYVTLPGHLTPRADTPFRLGKRTRLRFQYCSPRQSSLYFRRLANRHFLGSGAEKEKHTSPGVRANRRTATTQIPKAMRQPWVWVGLAITVWKRAK